MSQQKFKELIYKLGNCEKCINLSCKEKSLINIYKDFEFSTNIPSIWTDWFHRLDSEIVIVGQDWGPYNAMYQLNKKLFHDKSNWSELIESEKSNTKKLLEYYIRTSSNHKYNLDNLFITNAIMCARQGDNYRGNTIDLKKSTLNCRAYLLEQINIVHPKVILTLGYYPLLALANVFHFEISKTLRDTILHSPEIKVGDYVIIPLYHPVAQIKKEKQLEQYERIWKYLK